MFLSVALLIMLTLKVSSQSCCSFSPQSLLGGGNETSGCGVAIADYTGDGIKDVAIKQAYGNLYIYKGNGNGTFTLHFTYTFPTSDDTWQWNIAAGDVDADGDIDIVTAPQWSYAKMFVLKNNGFGNFVTGQQISNFISSSYHDLGDVDGDNDLDIVIAHTSSDNVYVYKNNGIGNFNLFATLSNTVRGHTVRLADIDNDGDLDIVIAPDTQSDGYQVRVFLNNGNGNYTLDAQKIGPIASYKTVEVADLNNDGAKDIIAGTFHGNLYIFKNILGSSAYFIQAQNYNTGSYYRRIKAADVNNDGLMDIIAGCYGGGNKGLEVWINRGNFNFDLCFYPSSTIYAHGMDIGDLDNNGTIDIVAGNFSNESIGLPVLNDGTVNHFTVNVVTNSPVCIGGTLTLSASSTGGGNPTYSWEGPNYYYAYGPNQTITDVTPDYAGTYTVTISYPNCKAIESSNVEITNSFSVIFQANSPVCEGQTFVVSNNGTSGGTPPFTYQWTGPDGFTSSLAEISFPNVTMNNNNTQFYVTVSDANGCKYYDSFTLIINESPSVQIQGNNQICEGSTLTLTASGGEFYTWSGPGGFQSTNQTVVINNVTQLNSGIYEVTVTNSQNCASVASVNVQINNNPTLSVVDTIYVLNNNSTTLNVIVNNGSGQYTYHWEPANLLDNPDIQQPTTVNLTNSTQFTVTVVDAVTGCSATDTIQVIVTGTPLSITTTASSHEICEGDSVIIQAIINGGNPPYTFNWSSIPSGFIANTSVISVSPHETTSYIIAVTDSNQTTAYDTIVITVNSLPQIIYNGQTIVCEGEPYILSLADNNFVSVTWQLPDGTVTQGQSISGTATTSLSGNIIVTAQNPEGCENSIIIPFTVNPLPEVNFNLPVDSICVEENALILSGGLPQGGSYSGNGVNNNIFYPQLAGPGMHIITYSYYDSMQCQNSAFDTIYVYNCTFIGYRKQESSVVVYPNPFTQNIHLQFSENISRSIKIEICEPNGKKLLSTTIHNVNNNIILPLEFLETGYYLLNIITDQYNYNVKLIKQK